IRFEVKFARARALIGGEHLQKLLHQLVRLIERRPPDVDFVRGQFILGASAMPYRVSADHSWLVLSVRENTRADLTAEEARRHPRARSSGFSSRRVPHTTTRPAPRAG